MLSQIHATSHTTQLGIGAGITAGAFWGLVFLAPELVPGFSALQLSAGRYLAYGIVAAILISRAWPRLRQRLSRADWRGLAWLSLPVASAGRFHQPVDATRIADAGWAEAHLARITAEALGTRVDLIAGPAAAGATPRRCPDIGKMRAMGYAPSIALVLGIARTVA